MFLELAQVPNQRQCPPQPMRFNIHSKSMEFVMKIDSPHPLVAAERANLEQELGYHQRAVSMLIGV